MCISFVTMTNRKIVRTLCRLIIFSYRAGRSNTEAEFDLEERESYYRKRHEFDPDRRGNSVTAAWNSSGQVLSRWRVHATACQTYAPRKTIVTALKDVNWRKNREDVSVIERGLDQTQCEFEAATIAYPSQFLSKRSLRRLFTKQLSIYVSLTVWKTITQFQEVRK